jgi:uncharacterized membrane protein
MVIGPKEATSKPPDGARPFRAAILRGLGVVVPPLLTVIIFIWIGTTVNQYVLRPLANSTGEALVCLVGDIRTDLPRPRPGQREVADHGIVYWLADDERYIPVSVYDTVRTSTNEPLGPLTSLNIYRRYVELRYLRPYFMIPFFLSLFILVLYLLGKFLAAGIGRLFLDLFEWLVTRVPVVRSVYSGVKQVSDFMFTEREIEFTRVVAVEYPRKGIWSLGFVTGESFLDIRAAANDQVVAVYIPCSPMPLTGFTINCLRSECIDLNITFDQACQFAISCGVVVPPHQLVELQNGTHPAIVPDDAEPNSASASAPSVTS